MVAIAVPAAVKFFQKHHQSIHNQQIEKFLTDPLTRAKPGNHSHFENDFLNLIQVQERDLHFLAKINALCQWHRILS
jgi:hypothetical protein